MFAIWAEMAAAFPETTALMLYMFMKIAAELVRIDCMFSCRMLLARFTAAAFPETAVLMLLIVWEFLLMLMMFSCRMLLVLAILSDIAAAFPETTALILDMLVLMLIMLTEAIMSRNVISPSSAVSLMSRALMSSSWSSASPFKA